MWAGVQHEEEGLFLRVYVAQMRKYKLPEIIADDINSMGRLELQRKKEGKIVKQKSSSASEIDDAEDVQDSDANDDSLNSGGTILESIEFEVCKFTEMNRLLVRMQHYVSRREMQIPE